jgi:hypothetical protein
MYSKWRILSSDCREHCMQGNCLEQHHGKTIYVMLMGKPSLMARLF